MFGLADRELKQGLRDVINVLVPLNVHGCDRQEAMNQ